MSGTNPTPSKLIAAAQSGIDLAEKAEADPDLKSWLQAQFDSYSHSPIVAGIVPIVAGLLSQEHLTVDNTLLTVVVGLAVTGAGYAWQWASMKINKPVPEIAGS